MSEFGRLKTADASVRDHVFETVVAHSLPAKISVAYQQGVSDATYNATLARTLDGALIRGSLDDLRALSALVEIKQPQTLPDDAGPLARLFQRAKMPDTAMVVADLVRGGRELKDNNDTQGGLFTMAVAVIGEAANMRVRSDVVTELTGGLLVVGLAKVLTSSFQAGRQGRLSEAALQILP